MTKDEAKEFIAQSVKSDVDMALVANAIKALEQKPKTGHWIAEENEEMETIGYYCSECDLPIETEEKTRFCPNCGAKMGSEG